MQILGSKLFINLLTGIGVLGEITDLFFERLLRAQ